MVAAGGDDGDAADKIPRRRPVSVPRNYTKQSADALSVLTAIDVELSMIETRVSELVAAVARGSPDEPLGPIKTEMAMLEARANRMETQGVDGVYTGDLRTGKVEAKELKKQMLARLEKVFEVIEGAFKSIKAASAARLAIEESPVPNKDAEETHCADS